MRKIRTRFYCGLVEVDRTPISKNVYLAVMNKHFTGYTVYTCTGYWEGEPEPSVVFEVLSPVQRDVPMYQVAGELRIAGNQNTVLVTSEEVFCDMVQEGALTGAKS
jgi:hypothetical protein